MTYIIYVIRFDMYVQMYESGSEFSSLFILANSPQTAILQYEEINPYTFITFLLDVGGIRGRSHPTFARRGRLVS